MCSQFASLGQEAPGVQHIQDLVMALASSYFNALE